MSWNNLITSNTFLLLIPSFSKNDINLNLDESEVIPVPENFLKSIVMISLFYLAY